MTKKVYVGNLPFRTTEEELAELFAQAGAVESVSIITDRETGRSKGFGFVSMNSEDADNAIAQFNGAQFGGRALVTKRLIPGSRGVHCSRWMGRPGALSLPFPFFSKGAEGRPVGRRREPMRSAGEERRRPSPWFPRGFSSQTDPAGPWPILLPPGRFCFLPDEA